jgi:hypothetical protein
MRSDRVGAGKCVKISKLWDISAHGSTHRPAMDIGVAANERGHQTTYLVSRWTITKVILATWCRQIVKNLEILTHFWSRIQIQTRYGKMDACM